MKELKFTKGEWIIERECDCTMIHDNSEDEFFVAKVSQNWNNHEANAMLICAAPDLFNALNELVRIKDDCPTKLESIAWDNARKAIEKAIGL